MCLFLLLPQQASLTEESFHEMLAPLEPLSSITPLEWEIAKGFLPKLEAWRRGLLVN